VTSASTSLPRILWRGARTNRKFFWLLGSGAVLWIVSIYFTKKADFAHSAYPLMMLGWLGGMVTLTFANGLSLPPSKRTDGTAVNPDRERARRWIGSSDPTFVDLSGSARTRAEQKLTAEEAANAPSIDLVALPALHGFSAACFGFSLSMALADTFLSRRNLFLDSPYLNGLFWGGCLAFMIYSSVWSIGRRSLTVHRWATDRAAVAARARADLERATLTALQTQMNPHFLFNTLNTVAALAGAESPRAERIVEHLSAVLRHSMQRADRPFTSLEDEMRFVREYLAVEQSRLGPRLRMTWNIDTETLPLRVPTMCLLPLIENAIAYGVESRPEGGHVQISSTRTAGNYLLRISVEDDGPGIPPDADDGVGLADLRKRLWAEYGRTFELDTETLPTGACVTINIPATRFELPAALAQQAEA
jgi:hypothetical protein